MPLKFICLISLTFVKLLFAQNNEFKDIGGNFQQKIEFEKASVLLKENDSLFLTVYKFDKDQTIKLDDSSKIVFNKLRTTFSDFKFKLGVENFSSELKKDSQYLLKYQSKEKNQSYEIYLKEKASKNQINEFQKYLKRQFKLEKIEFISKKEAVKLAKETLGVDSESLFEEDIFPASFKIESKSKIEIEEIKNNYSNIIDDIVNKNQDIGIIIFKIET